jgi:hypothetical protein
MSQAGWFHTHRMCDGLQQKVHALCHSHRALCALPLSLSSLVIAPRSLVDTGAADVMDSTHAVFHADGRPLCLPLAPSLPVPPVSHSASWKT